MGPFITFLVIIAVIWTLSGIATAANKRKEMERRRMLQMQLQRASSQQRAPAPPSQQQPRRISPGIASRFPDVLLPPVPAARRPQRAAIQPKRVFAAALPKPKQRRAVPQQQQQRQPQRRTGKPPAVPAPPPNQPAAPLRTPAPAVAAPSAKPQAAGGQVDAAAIARWATPSRLRQQFILTEIFQPPIALREKRATEL
jgi:hypothetical protein